VRDATQVTPCAVGAGSLRRVDVLVNNVGHWLRHPGNFVDTDPQLWDELYRVNLHHVFLVTHAFLPAMTEQHARIVNVSSVEGCAVSGGSDLCRIQSGGHSFTRSLAVQVGRDGVRVNAIGPDVTDRYRFPTRSGYPPRSNCSGRNGFRSDGWGWPRTRPA